MQQATVNLFADMGVQTCPRLQSGDFFLPRHQTDKTTTGFLQLFLQRLATTVATSSVVYYFLALQRIVVAG